MQDFVGARSFIVCYCNQWHTLLEPEHMRFHAHTTHLTVVQPNLLLHMVIQFDLGRSIHFTGYFEDFLLNRPIHIVQIMEIGLIAVARLDQRIRQLNRPLAALGVMARDDRIECPVGQCCRFHNIDLGFGVTPGKQNKCDQRR